MSVHAFVVGLWSEDHTKARIGICTAIIAACSVVFLWEKFKTNGKKKQDAVGKKKSTVAQQEGAGGYSPILPQSVNYHFTRQCNYSCGFCFHTAKTSFVLPIEDAKKGLRMLKEAGMEKVNFSGGEPFIVQRGKFVGELVRYCKEELELPSVTIVSNGSIISEKWFQDYGKS